MLQQIPGLSINPPSTKCPSCGESVQEGFSCDCGYPFACTVCDTTHDDADEESYCCLDTKRRKLGLY